ncbi:hypothetical protein CPB85DRAFT_1569524 [Mucidula mucida]|nr:hypothetical protein CPB85DRAFT_1569524 [Mucidula mucida]
MSSQVDFTDASSNHNFILDASDGARLYVLKAFLSYSSDLLKNLFMAEQNGEIGVPILKIAERGSTMLTILPFCYPGIPPPPSSFDRLLEVLLAIRKYLMQDVGARFEAALLASQITNEPLRMFAIVVHCKWESLARGAAKDTLYLPRENVESYVQELTLIPASAYHHLLTYHSKYSEVVVDALNRPTFLRLIGAKRHDQMPNLQRAPSSTNRLF